MNPQSQPSDAAWVIFTSGSTGSPKGIVLEHVSICSNATETGPMIGIDRISRVFQFAAYTFDVSIEEIVFTLILGGCICVPSEADRLSNLACCINELRVTWIDMTATIARLIEPSEVPSLRTLKLRRGIARSRCYREMVRPCEFEKFIRSVRRFCELHMQSFS